MGQEKCMHNNVDFHGENVTKEMLTSKTDSVLTTDLILNIDIDIYV